MNMILALMLHFQGSTHGHVMLHNENIHLLRFKIKLLMTKWKKLFCFPGLTQSILKKQQQNSLRLGLGITLKSEPSPASDGTKARITKTK